MLVVVFMCIFFVPYNSGAEQIIYTFTTTELSQTLNYSLPTYAGLEYSFFVDTERPGEYIDTSGETIVASDSSRSGDGYTIDWDGFYTYWISGYYTGPQNSHDSTTTNATTRCTAYPSPPASREHRVVQVKVAPQDVSRLLRVLEERSRKAIAITSVPTTPGYRPVAPHPAVLRHLDASSLQHGYF